MPDVDETPIERYIRYKESHEAWAQDTIDFGLNDDVERESCPILVHMLADWQG